MDIYGLLDAIAFMYLEMAPYIMFGLLFVGLMHLLVSKEFIARQIGDNKFSSILKASLLGIPLPLCSCGVIPTSVHLAKSGASKSSVVSFLISTPQTGVDSIIATYGLMGPVFAIFRPVAALLMGIFGGGLAGAIQKKTNESPKIADYEKDEVYSNEEVKKSKSAWQKIRAMSKYSFVEFLDDIAVQFIVGVIIAGLISYFIPAEFFADIGITSGILGMALVIAVGIPMYVCATASIPIAIALMMKGFSPGVAFVFLAVGPATNAASFAILSKTLGKQITLIYVGVISISAIIFGYLLDEIFLFLEINPHQMMAHQHEHGGLLSEEVKIIFGIVFSILLIMSLYRIYIKDKIKKWRLNMELKDAKKINIEGMTCNHCVANVKKAIEGNEGVKEADVLLNENMAYVSGDFDKDKVKKSIEDVGYKVIN